MNAKAQETISPDEARAVLQQEQEERVKACMEALPGFIARYGCELIPQFTIRGTQIYQSVLVVSAQSPQAAPDAPESKA